MKDFLPFVLIFSFLYIFSSAGAHGREKIYIKEVVYRDLKGIQVENEVLKVTILPERGANIASIVYKPTNKEWLWHNTKPYKLPPYGAPFAEYDTSGFDDCFPTVSECLYPDSPWENIKIPCHGELWTLPWECKIAQDKGEVDCEVYGIRLPYHFRKVITLQKNRIKINYTVKNLSPFPLKVIWAAHPLVAVSPGMKILLPKDTIVKEDISPWKLTLEEDKMLSIEIGGPSSRIAKKFFTEELSLPDDSAGWGAFYEPLTKEFILLTFPKETIPYIGIWINQAGFPFLPEGGHYNAAIEPTSCNAENIAEGNEKGNLIPLPPRSSRSWYLILTVGKAEKLSDILKYR
jgi:galactose mutarotase-like enzyme